MRDERATHPTLATPFYKTVSNLRQYISNLKNYTYLGCAALAAGSLCIASLVDRDLD